MSDITALRELRPAPPPAELAEMRMAARERFVAETCTGTHAGTAPKPAHPRWRRPALAGGLVAAAAASAAAGLVLTNSLWSAPGQGQPAGHARTVVTTAWTVREDADGTVAIYLQQYANPAGLQQTLQADGINAIVLPTPYTLQPGPRKPIAVPTCNYVTINDREPLAVQSAVLTVGRQALPALFIIHPAAIPTGSALFLTFMVNPPDVNGSTGNIAVKPVVLDDDTAPACVPVTAKPAPGVAPNPAVKTGRPAPSAMPKAA
jgi:hypothetical protein